MDIADGTLDAAEFGGGLAERGVFDSWDTDADGMLTKDEFDRGVYGTYDADLSGWDMDGDGALSETEFTSGVFGQYDWDANELTEEPEPVGFGDADFWDL